MVTETHPGTLAKARCLVWSRAEEVDPIRVTLVHSFYQSGAPSGENLAVEEQFSSLQAAGLAVDLFSRSTDTEAQSPLFSARSAVQVSTGIDLRTKALPQAESFRHILHVHNLFPNFGNRWIARWPGPVVATLHNYRWWCANGLFLRDGLSCTTCVDSGSMAATVHKCYRNSTIQSLPLSIATRSPEEKNPVLRRSTRIIAQNERMHEWLLRRGIARERISLIPGMVSIPSDQRADHADYDWAYVGRISSEKGLMELLKIWPSSQRLDVIGGGPLMAQAKSISDSAVNFKGLVSRETVLRELRHYKGLIFPGLCWEGAHPLVLREALVRGVPVVAATGSSAADFVQRTKTGAVFRGDSRSSLLSALKNVESRGYSLRYSCQDVGIKSFSSKTWLSRTLSAYKDAIISHESL